MLTFWYRLCISIFSRMYKDSFPLGVINIMEVSFTSFGCRFCCTLAGFPCNLKIILNVDAEICHHDRESYGIAFTYSVFLAPAWPPEGSIETSMVYSVQTSRHHHFCPLKSSVLLTGTSLHLHPLPLNILHLKIKYKI